MNETTAIIERIGWQEDEEHGRRFTATLVFPDGVPDLPLSAIWDRTPVELVVKEQPTTVTETTDPYQCGWCRGAGKVPQMDDGPIDCPVCKGTGRKNALSQTTVLKSDSTP